MYIISVTALLTMQCTANLVVWKFNLGDFFFQFHIDSLLIDEEICRDPQHWNNSVSKFHSPNNLSDQEFD